MPHGTLRPPRLLYLAFDACDAGLFVELAKSGHCPNLSALLADGAVVDTVAPYGTFVGSSWMTISTGAEVGTHRYWNWLEVDPDTYALRPTTPRESRRPPFWIHLSDAGRRVAVLDVPHADVPTDLNGVLLKEWGCHDRHHGTASHPASLLGKLEQQVGPHPYGSMRPPAGSDAFAPCDYTLRAGKRRTLDEERQLFDAMLQGVDAKRRASLAIIEDGPWDLFASVHGEGHCVGHQLWHVHDEGHPRHDPAARAVLGDPIVELYQHLDASLGAHLEHAGADTTVWVQMNHGMGPHYDGDHLLDELLRRLDPRHGGRPGWRTKTASGALQLVPSALRTRSRSWIAAAVRRRAAAAPPVPSVSTAPAADRTWYPIPGNTTVGAIRFNVAGREARGVVAPGRELEQLREELVAGLMEVVNVDTGLPAVRAVVLSDEVLDRSDDDGLPDLFVEWERSAPIDQVWSPRTGTVAAVYDHWRTGDHNDRGMVIVRGPGVKAGRRPTPMSLVDVAPTICATLGVDLPTADGHVRADLVPPTDGERPRPAPTGRLRALAATTPVPAPPSDPHRTAEAALGLAADTARRSYAAERQAAADKHEQMARLDDLMRRLEGLERERAVWATTAWLAHEPVVETDLVSVITPTHNRPDKLRRAIESVLVQRYPNWELIVVDDGSDSAKSVVGDVGDDRVSVISIQHSGVCAARNVGLSAARGSLIAYLDDDNSLDPGWLQAVVWGFTNHPEHDVLYGARVIDDWHRVHGRSLRGFPFIQYEPFDRARLEQGNFADMGVLAHRAGAAGSHFDEALWECGDWDFFLSLTEHEAPLELPAIAFYYRTDGHDRLTGRFAAHEEVVRQKWARRRTEGGGALSPA